MTAIALGGFSVIPATSQWNTLQVGGGGNVIWLDINPTDGTLLSGGDVFGAWISTTSNAGSNGNWKQLFTASSMPNTQIPRTFFTGSYPFKSAPSNSNTLVGMYSGNITSTNVSGGVLISRNKGATFTQITGITSSIPTVSGKTDAYFLGSIVFNPSDDSEFYIGIPNGGGIWHCTSYGATVARLDPGTIPAATSGFGYYGMSWQGTNIIIPVYGTGAYISSNSGSTWGASSGAPTQIFTGGYASDGTYFGLNYNGQSGANVYRRTTGGTWAQIGPGTTWWNGLAIDPNNKDHLATITFDGTTNVTTTATTTASWGSNNSSWTITTGDTPWMGWSFNSSFTFMNSNNCYFDSTGKFWVAMGIGIVYTSSLSGTVSYVPMTQGSEGLQANWARWTPGGRVLLAAWDRPFWSVSNPNAPQSVHGPGPDGTTIFYSDAIDYAQSNLNFLVGNKQGSLYSATDQGASNTWSAASNQILSSESCALAILSSSVWIVADTVNGNISVTANGASSWTTTPSGLPAAGFATGNQGNGHNVCWDAVTSGTAYAVSTAGTVYNTINSGVSWSQVSTTGALPAVTGAVRLKSVPGQAGHLFFTAGNPGTTPGGQPASTTAFLFFSSDGGATWTGVTNSSYLLTTVWDAGFSAAAPTQSYPSIGAFGWMKTASTGGVYVLDMWRCDNFNPASMTGNIWTQMFLTSVAEPSCVEGNPNTYNQWAIANGFGNSAMGFQYYGPPSITF